MAVLRKLTCALVLSGLLALPQMAHAQLGGIITGQDVDRVAELARTYGPAERRFDDAEDGPWIRAEMDDVVYTISFLNCIAGTDCTSVQLRAWWESAGAHTLEAVNQWNRERRFGAAYLDSSNNVTVEFDVNLAGGVTAVNFDDTLQWWQVVLREFVNQVVDPGYDAQGGGSSGGGTPPLSK